MTINNEKYIRALEWLHDLEVTDKEEQHKKALLEYIELLEDRVVFSNAYYDNNAHCIIIQ